MNKPLNRPLNRQGTVRDYSRRVERVIAHIGDNLDAELDLDDLAEVACFSPCHFHRIYHGLTGETVALHYWESRRLRWLPLADSLPRYPELPPHG
jgi:AraC family transcriptional regulator